MKSIGTLIKLQKSLVDAQRRELTQLQAILDRIDVEIGVVGTSRERETQAMQNAEPAARHTFVLYITGLKNRLEQLVIMRMDAVVAVEAGREKLAELFETQKRYEIMRDQRDAAALAEANRLEQAALDETAEQTHARRRREEG